jgi:septum formation protein
MKFFLGSSSPRRKELLESVGLEFEIVKPEVEEKHRAGELPQAYVERNARTKGLWVRDCPIATTASGNYVVIAADTIVTIDGEILEKPTDEADARRMLKMLSGRPHQVLTGVGLFEGRSAQRTLVYTEVTTVVFKNLSPLEIDAYIKTGEPFDKSGGYAAQGRGSYMVQSIQGSYSNVVGLPTSSLVDRLQSDFGINLF